MSARRRPLAARLLGALALVATTPWTASPQEPAYVRGLVLPVVDDDIGFPQGVTADLHTGEVFVCDARLNRILVFDTEGLFVYEMPGGDAFSSPLDLAVDAQGHLIVAAGREGRPVVVELDFDGLFLREIGLSKLPEGLEPPRVNSLAISPDGERLYLLDSANLRVWITSRGGEVLTSVDLTAGLSPKEARAIIPGQVDVYGDTLLVAVPSFSQIQVHDLDGKLRKVVGVRGTARCTLGFPTAAALSVGGDELVIVDQQRMLVLRWSVASNRCLGEYIGLGDLPGYLYYPMDLALDRSGQLFVAQGFEGRVQMYKGMSPAAASPSGP